jgi:hypothetical protein
MSGIVIGDLTVWLIDSNYNKWRLATMHTKAFPDSSKKLITFSGFFNRYTFLHTYHRINLPQCQSSHKTDLFILFSGMLL